MRIEFQGAITIAAVTIGIALAAVAARWHRWPFGLAACALLVFSVVSALFVLRHVKVLMNGPPGRRAAPGDDQTEPEEAAGVPGLGCGERRRVDTDGRATRTTLDSQP